MNDIGDPAGRTNGSGTVMFSFLLSLLSNSLLVYSFGVRLGPYIFYISLPSWLLSRSSESIGASQSRCRCQR